MTITWNKLCDPSTLMLIINLWCNIHYKKGVIQRLIIGTAGEAWCSISIFELLHPNYVTLCNQIVYNPYTLYCNSLRALCLLQVNFSSISYKCGRNVPSIICLKYFPYSLIPSNFYNCIVSHMMYFLIFLY